MSHVTQKPIPPPAPFGLLAVKWAVTAALGMPHFQRKSQLLAQLADEPLICLRLFAPQLMIVVGDRQPAWLLLVDRRQGAEQRDTISPPRDGNHHPHLTPTRRRPSLAQLLFKLVQFIHA